MMIVLLLAGCNDPTQAPRSMSKMLKDDTGVRATVTASINSVEEFIHLGISDNRWQFNKSDLSYNTGALPATLQTTLTSPWGNGTKFIVSVTVIYQANAYGIAAFDVEKMPQPGQIPVTDSKNESCIVTIRPSRRPDGNYDIFLYTDDNEKFQFSDEVIPDHVVPASIHHLLYSRVTSEVWDVSFQIDSNGKVVDIQLAKATNSNN